MSRLNRIPANVDREDRLLAGLTARQLGIVAATAVVGWAVGLAARLVVPLPVAAGLISPRLAAGPAGPARPRPRPRRDHRPWRGRRRAAVPGFRGQLLPSHRGGAAGAGGGVRALPAQRHRSRPGSGAGAARRPARHDRRAGPAPGGLPHPALEAAARQHARFLAGLAARRDVLRSELLACFRQPTTTRNAAGVLLRRAEEAVSLLAAAGITLTVLDQAAATAALAQAADPETAPRPAGLAAPGETITSTGRVL